MNIIDKVIAEEAVKSLDDLFTFAFTQTRLLGPKQPVRDYRVVAGLLFCRYNDGSRRAIKRDSSKSLYHTLEIVWYGDRGPTGFASMLVTAEATEKLLEERMLNGTPEMGYTDMHRLILSPRGKKQVITEWFTGGGLTDALKAGAVFTGGEFKWG